MFSRTLNMSIFGEKSVKYCTLYRFLLYFQLTSQNMPVNLSRVCFVINMLEMTQNDLS